MNDLTTFLLQPEWQRIGITLLHFLWQGAAILLGAWAIARVLKVPNGAGRYGLYLAAFAVMSVAPIITYKMANPVIEGTPNPAAAVRVDATTVAPESNRGTATDVAPESATTSPRLGSASVEDSAATELFGARSEILWAVTWLPRVVAFWVIGVTLLGVWFLLGLLGVWRLRRSGKRTDDSRVLALVDALAAKLGLKKFGRVLVSEKVRQPLVLGFLRPAILLPARMLTGVPEDALRASLAHELAHIRRKDVLVNGLQRVVEVVLFYHPAVWVLSGLVRKEREICCDEDAVKATGDRLAYAEMLETFYEAKLGGSPAMAAALGGNGRSTLRRVRHVLGMGRRSSQRGWTMAGVLAAMAAFALVAGVGVLHAEEKKKETQENEKAILGKWRAGKMAVEFLPDGNLKVYDGDNIEGGTYKISGDWIFLDLENEGEKSGMFMIKGDAMKVEETELVRVRKLDPKKLVGAWRGPDGQKIEFEEGRRIYFTEKQEEVTGTYDEKTNRVTLDYPNGEAHSATVVIDGDMLTVDGNVKLKLREGTGKPGELPGIWEAAWGPEGRGDIRVEVSKDGKVHVFSYKDIKGGKFEVNDDVIEITFENGDKESAALRIEGDEIVVNGKERMRRWAAAEPEKPRRKTTAEDEHAAGISSKPSTKKLAGLWAADGGVIEITEDGQFLLVEDNNKTETGTISIEGNRIVIRKDGDGKVETKEFVLEGDELVVDETALVRIAGPTEAKVERKKTTKKSESSAAPAVADDVAVEEDLDFSGFERALERLIEARRAIALLEGPDIVKGGDPSARKVIQGARFELKRCHEELALMETETRAGEARKSKLGKKLEFHHKKLDHEISEWESKFDAQN